MAEASAIIGIIRFGTSLTTTIKDYIENVKEGKEDIAAVANEIQVTIIHIEDLDKLIKENDTTHGWDDNGLFLANKCVSDLDSVLKKINRLLANVGGTSKEKKFIGAEEIRATPFGRLSWPFQKPKWVASKERLSTIKIDILLAKFTYQWKVADTAAERAAAAKELVPLTRSKAAAKRRLEKLGNARIGMPPPSMPLSPVPNEDPPQTFANEPGVTDGGDSFGDGDNMTKLRSRARTDADVEVRTVDAGESSNVNARSKSDEEGPVGNADTEHGAEREETLGMHSPKDKTSTSQANDFIITNGASETDQPSRGKPASRKSDKDEVLQITLNSQQSDLLPRLPDGLAGRHTTRNGHDDFPSLLERPGRYDQSNSSSIKRLLDAVALLDLGRDRAELRALRYLRVSENEFSRYEIECRQPLLGRQLRVGGQANYADDDLANLPEQCRRLVLDDLSRSASGDYFWTILTIDARFKKTSRLISIQPRKQTKTGKPEDFISADIVFKRCAHKQEDPAGLLDILHKLVTQMQPDIRALDEDSSKKAEPSPDAPRAVVHFKDAVGRAFTFPFEACRSWKKMEGLIKQAFLHIETLGEHVLRGHYDLTGPDGEIILPQVWDMLVQPDWEVTMHLWPMPEPSTNNPANAAAMAGDPFAALDAAMAGDPFAALEFGNPNIVDVGSGRKSQKKEGKKKRRDKAKDRLSAPPDVLIVERPAMSRTQQGAMPRQQTTGASGAQAAHYDEIENDGWITSDSTGDENDFDDDLPDDELQRLILMQYTGQAAHPGVQPSAAREEFEMDGVAYSQAPSAHGNTLPFESNGDAHSLSQ